MCPTSPQRLSTPALCHLQTQVLVAPKVGEVLMLAFPLQGVPLHLEPGPALPGSVTLAQGKAPLAAAWNVVRSAHTERVHEILLGKL